MEREGLEELLEHQQVIDLRGLNPSDPPVSPDLPVDLPVAQITG